MNVGKITGNEYFEFRIATLRHAIVAVLKQGRSLLLQSAEGKAANNGDEGEDEEDDGNDTMELYSSVVATHFKSCRRRLFLSLREELHLLTDFPTFLSRLSKEVHNLIQELQLLKS